MPKTKFKTLNIDEKHMDRLTESAKVLDISKPQLLRPFIDNLYVMLDNSETKRDLVLNYSLNLIDGQIIITIEGFRSSTFRRGVGKEPKTAKEAGFKN